MTMEREESKSDKYIKYNHTTQTDGSKKEEIWKEKEIISLPLKKNDM